MWRPARRFRHRKFRRRWRQSKPPPVHIRIFHKDVFVNLSKFFIDRPIFAGVISVAIFLAGLLSMFLLPISEYPEVVPPSIVVTAQFPGANLKVIAETVATPLDEQMNATENMLYMFSQAASDGT